MYALIDFARHLAVKELWVYTGSSDSIAVNFYRSLGFEVLGAAADWAPGRTMDNSDIVLRRILSWTEIRKGPSFLIGAGASMNAGGVGLASIPLELEKMLHEKAQRDGGELEPDSLSLFYASCSAIAGQAFESTERRKALVGDLGAVPKIPINLEDYLSHLQMWRAGMSDSTKNTCACREAAGQPPKTSLRRHSDFFLCEANLSRALIKKKAARCRAELS